MNPINKLLLYFSGFAIKSKKGNIEATPVTSKIAENRENIKTIKKYNFCLLENSLYSLVIEFNNIYVSLVNINN